jgi:hypothetical protein
MMPLIGKWLKLARLLRALKIDVVAYAGYMDYPPGKFYDFEFGQYKTSSRRMTNQRTIEAIPRLNRTISTRR